MISDALIANVKIEEGLRLHAYGDGDGAYLHDGAHVSGNPTIGYGTNLGLGAGITEAEASYLLVNRLAAARQDCQSLSYFNSLSLPRADAINDMMYNMGHVVFAQFTTFHSLMAAGDFAGAAADLQTTAWIKEVGQRGQRLVRVIASGVWEVA